MNLELRWAVIETLRRGREQGLKEREAVVLSALGLRADGEEVPMRLLAAATGYQEREVRASVNLLKARGMVWHPQACGTAPGYELTDLGARVVAEMEGEY